MSDKSKVLTVRLPLDTWREFSKKLIDDGLSAQQFFSGAVQEYLKEGKRMVTRESLLAGGYTPAELDGAGAIVPGTPWHERPDLRQVDGVLQYCNYRCLSSEYGGGNCRCINHPPEEWVTVTD